jgi:hypothetical protein
LSCEPAGNEPDELEAPAVVSLDAEGIGTDEVSELRLALELSSCRAWSSKVGSLLPDSVEETATDVGEPLDGAETLFCTRVGFETIADD